MSPSLTPERLYALLPSLYRLRDAEHGEPLRAVLAALAGELAALEENLAQLYDDQFIETCAPWVTPYIGDLIGYRPLHGAAPEIASPRADVANTIARRRRKGTAVMLEQVARDVTAWPSRAAEFFEQLTTTQYMKHTRLHARATANLRDTEAMLRRGGAFNAVAHTADTRRPEGGVGRYNIPNIGIFLWRLQALRLTAVPLTPDPSDTSGRRFRVNPLGADLQLFRQAATESEIEHTAEPVNVPEPLSVRLMALAVRATQASTPPSDSANDDYGAEESLVLLRGTPPDPVPVGSIRISDLRDIVDGGGNLTAWNHQDALPSDVIGIDPERGRVLLGANVSGPLFATFHYGSARGIGGGEYERLPEGEKLARQEHVGGGAALQPLLTAIAPGGRLSIHDSLTYAPPFVFKVNGVTASGEAGLEAVVAAVNPARPLLAAAGDLTLDIGARGRLVLDGLVISGGALRLAAAADNETRELVLRECTLVPGRSQKTDGSAVSPGAPSLIVEHPFAKVRLERCITGPLQVVAEAEVTLQDCIIDAGAPENVAYSGDGALMPGAELTARECTVIGKLHTQLLRLASNSIFFARLATAPLETWTAPFVVQRKQEGCARFSFIPSGSVTPRRFRCLPDAENPTVPHFTSLRYGDPAYAQLRLVTSQAIRTGAEDGGEMGVMHALFQPQREINLRVRLEEYLRFGLRAGAFYET
jgi:hypothetical protein